MTCDGWKRRGTTYHKTRGSIPSIIRRLTLLDPYKKFVKFFQLILSIGRFTKLVKPVSPL